MPAIAPALVPDMDVKRQPRLFQHAQHAQMRHAFGAAARQGDAHRNAAQCPDQAVEPLTFQTGQTRLPSIPQAL